MPITQAKLVEIEHRNLEGTKTFSERLSLMFNATEKILSKTDTSKRGFLKDATEQH